MNDEAPHDEKETQYYNFDKGQIVDGRTICGAKTRSGTPCKRSPMPNGRCNLHGGKSLGGIASPTFKHGRYSKYLPSAIAQRYEAARSDPDLLALREEIALLDSRQMELIQALDTGESGELWENLQAAHEALVHAKELKEIQGMADALTEMGDLINRGADNNAVWDEIVGLFDQRRRLVESERKRLVEMQQIITAERAMILISAVVNAVAKHVDDRRTLNAIATDIRGLVAGQGGLNAGSHSGAGAGRATGRAADPATVDGAISDHPG